MAGIAGLGYQIVLKEVNVDTGQEVGYFSSYVIYLSIYVEHPSPCFWIMSYGIRLLSMNISSSWYIPEIQKRKNDTLVALVISVWYNWDVPWCTWEFRKNNNAMHYQSCHNCLETFVTIILKGDPNGKLKGGWNPWPRNHKKKKTS